MPARWNGYRKDQGAGEIPFRARMGRTAVGNGVNAHPEFAPRSIALISAETGCLFLKPKTILRPRLHRTLPWKPAAP